MPPPSHAEGIGARVTVEIGLVLGLLIVTVSLFVWERVSVDLVGLLVLLALIVAGILEPGEAFAAFANDIVVILVSIFIVSGALMRTGVMDWAALALSRLAGGSFVPILVTVMLVTALASTVLNNTVVTAVFLPAVVGLCRRTGIAPGKLLIPLAYASMLGGTCTLIGTSTNIAASGFLEQLGGEPFGLFEFLPVGGTMVIVGTAWVGLVGWRLLPATARPSAEERMRERRFLSEIVLSPGAKLVGQTIGESGLEERGLVVMQILRGGREIFPDAWVRLEAGDTLVVHADRDSLLGVKETAGIDIKPEVTVGAPDRDDHPLHVVEAMVLPQSRFLGRTLADLDFRRRFGLTVLAIFRQGHRVLSELSRLRLHTGDVLLIQGPVERTKRLFEMQDLWILEELGPVVARRRKALWVAAAFLIALALAGAGVVPLAVAFLAAALFTVLSGCVAVEDAYALVDWRLIVLIATMTSFGVAMEHSGAAEFLAQGIVELAGPLGIPGLLVGFAALTMLLTQPMSNAAAALVVLPVAVSTAAGLGANPRSFAVLVTLAASLSFISPWEPSCLLVYGAGGYRVRDFVFAGVPLTLLSLGILVGLVMLLWPPV